MLVPQIFKGDVDGLVGMQIGAVPVLQIWEPIGEVVQLSPRERVQNRTPEQVMDSRVPHIIEAVLPGQIMDSSMPQIMENSLPFAPQEHVQNRVAEIVGIPVPQIVEDFLPFVPQERVHSRTQEQLVDVPAPQIMEAIVENRFPELLVDVPQITEAIVENRFPEQIVNSPVPQFMGADVEIMHDAPQGRMQTRTLEQTAAFPAPQISEGRVPEHSPEQIMDFPVSQNMEGYAGRVRDIPLERVQHHSFVRPKRVFVDFLPLHSASKPYTGKVFTVNLRHHRDDFAHSDNSGFIKGLDKHNMPRLGDVMVPPPQINKVSWFDRKPQAAADEPLYRFYQRYSGRSGRSKLKR